MGGGEGGRGLDDDASSAVVYLFSAKFHHVVYGRKKTYKKIYISLWDDHFRQLFLSLKNEINSLFKLFNLFFDNYNYRVV